MEDHSDINEKPNKDKKKIKQEDDIFYLKKNDNEWINFNFNDNLKLDIDPSVLNSLTNYHTETQELVKSLDLISDSIKSIPIFEIGNQLQTLSSSIPFDELTQIGKTLNDLVDFPPINGQSILDFSKTHDTVTAPLYIGDISLDTLIKPEKLWSLIPNKDTQSITFIV